MVDGEEVPRFQPLGSSSDQIGESTKNIFDDLPDTDQEKSASFEREGGASWNDGRGLEGAARTGGAARHAGQCAE
jgi:hypothetical protein